MSLSKREYEAWLDSLPTVEDVYCIPTPNRRTIMRIGDTVTYAKTRETQSVQPDRRNAKGVVRELDEIDGFTCARICWEWAPEIESNWVRANRLEVVSSPTT